MPLPCAFCSKAKILGKGSCLLCTYINQCTFLMPYIQVPCKTTRFEPDGRPAALNMAQYIQPLFMRSSWPHIQHSRH